jgi:hypothetical protein
MKGTLQGLEFAEKGDLLAEIGRILNGISGKASKRVFIQWEKPLQTCIDAGSEYVEQSIIYTITHVQQPSRRVYANAKRNTL